MFGKGGQLGRTSKVAIDDDIESVATQQRNARRCSEGGVEGVVIISRAAHLARGVGTGEEVGGLSAFGKVSSPSRPMAGLKQSSQLAEVDDQRADHFRFLTYVLDLRELCWLSVCQCMLHAACTVPESQSTALVL